MHEEEQTGSSQQARTVSTSVCPNTVEVPQIDTSPSKTMIVLQGVCLSLQTERAYVGAIGAVHEGGRISEGDDGMNVSEFYAQKLR